MSSHKNHEKLEKIKEAISKSTKLSEEEKSNAIKHIEQWYMEDKAFGLFLESLFKISKNIQPLLEETGVL
jgi:hypothetical protein